MDLKKATMFKVSIAAIEQSEVFKRIESKIRETANQGNFSVTVSLEGCEPIRPESLQLYFERLGYRVTIGMIHLTCNAITINWN